LIQTENAKIYEKVASDKSRFWVSDSWVWRFVNRKLGWTLRKATQKAHKLPGDAELQMQTSWYHHAFTIFYHNVPAELRINGDQTQIVLQPPSCFTYDTRGARQVPIIGKDEKQAMTLMTTISASGELLPFQAIFKGRTAASLPNPSPDNPELKAAYNEAINLGFRFEFAGESDTYWSTLQTMKDWVTFIVVPYFQKKKTLLGLQPDHACILQLDVWSVHSSKEFRQWMWDTFPYIILLYVPGGCTGVWQPCDVAIQRLLKQAIITHQNQARVQEVASKLQSGMEFATLRLDESLKFLRDQIPSSIVYAFKLLSPKKDFIKSVCFAPISTR
jgi:hypothetical protein